MSETVSLKRPRSTSNNAEEPDEKYVAHAASQQMMMNPNMANMARGVQPVGFPLMQYCHMIQQMQNQQMEYPMGMIRKEKEDAQSASTTPASSRRQTMSKPSMGPRPIRVPHQSLFNPLQFGLMPHQLAPPVEESVKSPSPAAAAPPTTRPQSPHHIYNIPSFQRADEEIYSKFVESVRVLAAKLAGEKS
ncbi:hypothetical protein CRE_10227 [Caenorhabditis remanei]|uniref:Uncharacterized protein n=2 Tax=Caenorhabditis remanei TaxID=31234 RepID=E3M602_CAERE|nr:hypothetical protein CRE_10227 [Caenorhabditis remanei]